MKTKKVVFNLENPEELSNDEIIFAHHFTELNSGAIDVLNNLIRAPLTETSPESIIESFCHQVVMLSAHTALFYKRSTPDDLNKYMNKVCKTAVIETINVFKNREVNK